MKKVVVYITAGGTGGHLFPALSLAEKLVGEGYEVTFVTDPQGASIAVDLQDVSVKTLPLSRASGGVWQKVRFCYDVVKSIIKSCRLIWRKPVDMIIGFGGYPSFPLIFAGILQGRVMILHEQNAYLGKVNRFAARSVKKIATSFEAISGINPKDRAKTVITGNIVRQQVLALYHAPYKPADIEDDFRIFVIGGSQGARTFSYIVPEAVKILPGFLQDRIVIVQQSRPELLEETRQRYLSLNVRATVEIFFHAIDKELAAAHMVIGRSGASTISELMLAGRPAMLVPFPYAADDHQYYNAIEIERANAGWCCREEALSATRLAQHIERCMTHPDLLVQVSRNMRALARPDALDKLSALVSEEIQKN